MSLRSSEHHGGSAHSQHLTHQYNHGSTSATTVSQVLDFLHKLYELGLSYSSAGAHRSAASAIVGNKRVPQLREH